MNLNSIKKIRSTGIVGRISPKTWAAMEVFLGSIAIEDYDSMASSLIEMGATNQDVDAKAFARDLEKVFSSIKASIVTHKYVNHMWDFVGECGFTLLI